MLLPVRRWTRARRTLRAALLALVLAAVVVAGPLASEANADSTAPVADEASPGVRDSVVRLYFATLDRAPDRAGLDHWVGHYLDGLPLASVAQGLMTSPEWTSRYDRVDDAELVTLLYDNVLDRAPDEAGFTYWHRRLLDGHARTAVVLGFSESAEFVSATGTAAPEPPPPAPWPLVPDGSGHGRRIVYDNDAQRLWMVGDDGRTVHSHLVSGRAGVPAPGTYSVFSESELAWAGHDGITMQWMVRFAHGRDLPIGFHAIPRHRDGTPLQSERQLGTYQSAGCVRQADDDARLLYDWADVGTTVVVLP